jgi:hypothetical protein
LDPDEFFEINLDNEDDDEQHSIDMEQQQQQQQPQQQRLSRACKKPACVLTVPSKRKRKR